MSFLIGLILGGFVSYLIVSYTHELKLRLEILEDSLGFDKEYGYKWLNEKNPGIGLKKPSDLSFNDFYNYVKQIEYGQAL